jgi:dynein heavy chain
MLALLEKCEKSLAQYLELKRRAFPRFYFVSSADLLDILSKGRDPQAITRHIGKIFESIATLEYSGSSIVAIKSKEGEYLKLSAPVTTGGAVESWLADLLKGISSLLSNKFNTNYLKACK